MSSSWNHTKPNYIINLKITLISIGMVVFVAWTALLAIERVHFNITRNAFAASAGVAALEADDSTSGADTATPARMAPRRLTALRLEVGCDIDGYFPNGGIF